MKVACRPGWFALVDADLRLALRHNAGLHGHADLSLQRRISWLFTPCMLLAMLHRTAHLLWRSGWRRTALSVSGLSRRINRIDLHPACELGPGLYIPHPAGVSFCGHSAGELVVLSASTTGGCTSAGAEHWPRFGLDVWVGVGACVHGPVRVGDHARIGPGVVLTKDLAARHAALSRAYRP